MGSSVNPNLELSTANNERYPNPFFDLAQQYMPPTIKELFKWCTFYFYNSPLIGSSIKKISRYPITDLIYEDTNSSTRDVWEKILTKELRMKDRLMEVNLDYHVYGNAFVSLHLPFTRFLACKECGNSQPIKQWDWSFSGTKHAFHGKCNQCKKVGPLTVRDVPYKNRKGIRLIRWNPENMHIKYNEYTSRYTYMYSVPKKLRNAIERGDRDIVVDVPLIVIEAVRKRRKIRLNEDAIKHLKNPTLAEQDQGWGKPTIIHVLKDMFYFYTLRRAQESIALEHIVPFDVIFPLPNASQDPYVHTDLGDWKNQIEKIVKKQRRDPNFKSVIPIPIGHARLGGDGKALMLSPEMNYLTQTIVGGMGIPQEFLFGGLSWSGSSISLRTLENDFVQNRSQLLDLTFWVKDKIRIWLSLPDVKSLRFADFRMADDVQRNQQIVGLNAQKKLSDQTMLTELGFDYEDETQKIIEETYLQNYLMDLQSKGSAKSQGESQIISWNYQQKVQELAEKSQDNAQRRAAERFSKIPSNVSEKMPSDVANQQMGPWGDTQGLGEGAQMEQGGDEQQPQIAEQSQGVQEEMPTNAEEIDEDINGKIQRWASKLNSMDTNLAMQTLAKIKEKMPDMGKEIEKAYNAIASSQMQQQGGFSGGESDASKESERMNGVNMSPLPEQKQSTRAGQV